MNATSGFVDSGTMLLLLPTPAYQAYVEATNATLDNDVGLLRIDDPKNLQSLYFHIGNVSAFILFLETLRWGLGF